MSYVNIVARVVPGACHPEDIIVSLESHNQDYKAHVRKDRTTSASVPTWVLPCTSLFHDLQDETGVLFRCAKEYHHDDLHTHPNYGAWTDEETYGYVEEV